MIQFNLLPDIKLEYIKAKRVRRTVILISSILTGVSFSLFLLLFITVNIFQKKHITDLTSDIQSQKSQLESIPDLDKVLTIQNQLNKLTELHDAKPAATRLFTYLPQLVPQQATIADFNIDYTELTMEFKGSADSLTTVNKFVDTLKFTQYTNEDEEINAFSEVVLTEFSTASEDQNYNYTVNLKFDPFIFDSENSVSLAVPSIISTRSETEKPSKNLFREQAETIDGGAQ